MYYNRIFPLPDLLGSGVYAGASAEVGRITDRFDGLPSPGTLWSGSVFLGADTFLGPGLSRRRRGAGGQLEPLPAARRAVAGRRRPGFPVGPPRQLFGDAAQPPGGLYAIDCFAAASTSATVISTTVFTAAPPA